jgi:2-polyprenyl-3-methyl-5-hydroxy-6-metoxy-1,4-benzoquinol methylase
VVDNYTELNAAQEVSETDPFTLDRYRQFFRYFPTQTHQVLDVGCNTGRGGKILKQLNQRLSILGLDCVQNRLDRLPSDIYDEKICSFSTNIALEAASVDVIVAGEFIEHLYPEDVSKTLQEFRRLLKPQGRLLLTTPNPNYLRLKLTNGSVLGGAHVSQHYPNQLKQDLAQSGFINIVVLGSGKMSRFIGEQVPFLFVYGSYLAIADKS